MAVSQAWQHWRLSWSNALANIVVHVFLVIVSAGVFVPVVAAMTGMAVSLSGQSALTDQDIARFLLTPFGLICGIFLLSLVIVVVILDVAVMTVILRSGATKPFAALHKALMFLSTSLPSLVDFAARLLIRVLVVVLPFVVLAGAAAIWFMRDYDINYYLSQRPPEFMVVAGLVAVLGFGVLTVLLRQLLAWSVALHFVLFEGVAAKEAFNLSASKMRPRRWTVFAELLAWGVLRAVIGLCLGALATAFVLVVSGFLGDQLLWTAIVLVVGLSLTVLGNMIVTAIANGALADLLNAEYEAVASPAVSGDLPLGASLQPVSRFWSVLSYVILGLVMVGALASLFAGSSLVTRIQPVTDVEVIGHRGAAGSRPENTIASIEAAVQEGADWVEIDVQETADGQVIVAHDSDFMKAAGVDLKVWDATMQDVAEIDIGSWFDSAYSDQRAPLLSEVLDVVKDRTGLLIELKYYGHDVDLENRVIALVEDAGLQDQVSYMSLKYPAVEKMAKLRPEWRGGVLAATAVGDLTGLQGDFIAINVAQISAGLISRASRAGKQVYAWTVNDTATMSRMISMGVNGLITDYPAQAREVIAWQSELSPLQRMVIALSDRTKRAFRFAPQTPLEP